MPEFNDPLFRKTRLGPLFISIHFARHRLTSSPFHHFLNSSCSIDEAIELPRVALPIDFATEGLLPLIASIATAESGLNH
jgi:hypothetical protein